MVCLRRGMASLVKLRDLGEKESDNKNVSLKCLFCGEIIVDV